MNANLQLLQAGLTDFGLNPADWILETENQIGPIFELALRHYADAELTLQGWAMQETWLTLSFQG